MAQIKQISKDQYLVREGEKPNAFYIVKSGSLMVTQMKGSLEQRYADVQPGELIGEQGLFENSPSRVNIKAVQNSEVIEMPYEAVYKQLDQVPGWTQALLKSLISQLQRSFQYIHSRISEVPIVGPPSLALNKYLAIFNLVSLRYEHQFNFHQLRNYTIQVFQEPTSKMVAVTNTLIELGYVLKTAEGENETYKTLRPAALLQFVDWYNDWLFKPERSRMILLKEDEVVLLKALIAYAKTQPVDSRGFTKINLNTLQTESATSVGRAIRREDITLLTSKKYFAEPTMEEAGVHILIPCDELEYLAENCHLLNALQKLF